MFGTLRLFLAAVVVLSHIIASPPEFSFGVSAVVVFFVISGYAMTGLVNTRFVSSRSPFSFYLERIIRLAPQYYFWLAVSIVIGFGLRWMPPILLQDFFPYGLFAYLTVIPLGLQGTMGPVHTLILSQASSLGIEIICYLISPWLLKSRILSWLAAVSSLSVFIATDLKSLPEALYTYYSFPGPLVLFVIGSFIYRKDWISVSVLTSASLAIFLTSLQRHYNLEFAVGLLVGVPAIILLSHLPARKWDSELGNASYGCFLGHGCVNWTVFTFPGYVSSFAYELPAVAIILSCLLGYAAFYGLEKPTIAFRRSLGARKPFKE